MNQKDFDSWNDRKKLLQERIETPFFKAREIWWCSLGVNVGFEQDGTGDNFYRPVLILKGLGLKTCFVIPLTTSENPHRLRPSVGLVAGKEARALISQIRVIDSRRLINKMCYLEKSIFSEIRKTVRQMF